MNYILSFLFVSFIGLQLFDFYSTYHIIFTKKGYEANPVLRKLMSVIGLGPALVLKTIFTIVAGSYLLAIAPTIGSTIFMLILLDGFYAYVAFNNLKIMRV